MKNKNAIVIPFIIILTIIGAVIAWFLITSNAGVSSNPKDLTSGKTKENVTVSKGLKGHVDPTSISSGQESSSPAESSVEDCENANKSRDDSLNKINEGKDLIRESLSR